MNTINKFLFGTVLMTLGLLAPSALAEITWTRTEVTTENSPYVLEEGKTYTAAPTDECGAVFNVSSGATLTGTNVTFASNTASNEGGAIYNKGKIAFDGAIDFSDNVSSTQDGGAISTSGEVTFTGAATFERNSGHYGGAIGNSGVLTFDSSATFADNKAAGDASAGGAVENYGGTIAFADVVTFTNNSADIGGAIYNESNDDTKGVITFAKGATFNGNSASLNAGAICNDGVTINFAGLIDLQTAGDTWYNRANATVNWDLTGGLEQYGSISHFERYANENGTIKQLLSVTDDQPAGDYVIATGDFTDITGKDTFTITNVTGGVTATITIGGIALVNGTWWSLVIEGGDKLVLKTAETVTLSGVMTGVATNASEVVVSVNGQTIEEKAGSYEVPKGCEVSVTYTAKDDYMFAGGAKTKSVTVGPLTGNYAMTDADKPTAEAQWVDVRTIAIDTRERIIVGDPSEVLPIAYSTNFWGEATGGKLVGVSVQFNDEDKYTALRDATNENGYCEWMLTPGALGKYTLRHVVVGGPMNFTINSNFVYYSTPFPLTIVEPAEGGSIVAITNGIEATGTFDVLGFENVTIAAKPEDERWALKEMYALTNGLEVALTEEKSSLTNKFEMPCCETVVTGAFVIAETYRAELADAATNNYLATSNNLEKLRHHRLSDAEADAAIAAARGKLNSAVDTIAGVTKPGDGESATNTLATALADVETEAQAASDGKPTDFVIASDFSANPPFGDYDAETGTFTWNGQVWTNGVNAFTSFTDAFTNETYGAFATNLHVFGAQTIATEPSLVDMWNLDLITYEESEGVTNKAVISVGTEDDGNLANITNKLGLITGAGDIVLGKTEDKVDPSIYDDFIADGAEIKVVNSGVEPQIGSGNIEFVVDVNAKIETDEEGARIVVVPGAENQIGAIAVCVAGTATNDVVVAGSFVAPNGAVTIQNDSTNVLSVSEKIKAKALYINNHGRQDDREGSVLVSEATVSGDVNIQNNAHLEANIVAGGKISILNGNVNTLVGTYAGSTIELSGADPGALSNATFVSDGPVNLNGRNVLTGPFMISAPSVNNGSEVIFSVLNDNTTTWLNDFDLISTNQTSATFGVLVDAAQTDGDITGVYTLAAKATSAVGKAFSVSGGSVSTSILAADGTDISDVEAKTLYSGAKAYSLRVDAAGALVFEIKWGKFAITYDAMGPYFTAGETVVVSDSYVHIGYALPEAPVRAGYTFDGWYDGVTNGAPEAASHTPLCYTNEHTVFARWTANGGVPTAALALAADGTLTPAGNVGNNLVLPDTIGGEPVLTVGKAAFAAANYKTSAITNLVTGSYLRSIEPGAFNQVTTLKTLTISEARDFDDPSTVVPVTIGKRAFAGTRIESLEIAAGTIIGEQAFRGCSYLKEIAFFGDAANPSLTAANVDAFTLCGYANGTGKIKLYMSDAFKTANAAFVTALKNSYAASNVEISDLAGYSPATSVSVDGLDVSQPTELSLTVAADALIAGTFAHVSSIKILYREQLTDPEREYVPTSVTRNANGTYTLKFTAPNDGRSGFMRVIVK